MILELSEEGRNYMFKLWAIDDDPDLEFEDLKRQWQSGVPSKMTETQEEDLNALVHYATSEPAYDESFFVDNPAPGYGLSQGVVRRLFEEGYLVDAEDGINI